MRPSLNYLRQLRNQIVWSASAIGLTTLTQTNFCTTKEYYFNYGSHMIPHPEKVHKGGEDALFADKKILVVADGVGGWADLGIDPGLYSKELCKKLEEAFKQNPEDLKNPKKYIIAAHKVTKAKGSTTVCVVSINQGDLRSSLVGDSGYAIYRKIDDKYQLNFKSTEQQKSFNFPYQIGSEGDNPNVATDDTHKIQVGDLVVLGTDGLFDNMSAQQIQVVIEDVTKTEPNNPQALAKSIANYAYRLSLDPKYNSPFAQHAKQSRLRYMGGKSDDITVIVAFINEQ
ncbi:unnamed protein product [Paramecium pentaurelia]|uniref:Protein phosphatase n=1 Tax=Paramecium pentaurelia TaxID=43138 RepID=A0A8S1X667_9CILI|nr:unnamed protein product [Paramecium pentaurelia]